MFINIQNKSKYSWKGCDNYLDVNILVYKSAHSLKKIQKYIISRLCKIDYR